ncbi:MAG: hypothetical protein QOE45_1356 [Frankiaceae bacterium]|jgi:DNA-binding CsgD family transcriptional regulator|nr:hypothetical protein [Frankiaceae bacterium]
MSEFDVAASPLGGTYALSPREVEVLRHFAAGLTYDQAARRMGVTRHTVDTYLRRVRGKTGAGSGAHLTRLAVALEDELQRRAGPVAE